MSEVGLSVTHEVEMYVHTLGGCERKVNIVIGAYACSSDGRRGKENGG